MMTGTRTHFMLQFIQEHALGVLFVVSFFLPFLKTRTVVDGVSVPLLMDTAPVLTGWDLVARYGYFLLPALMSYPLCFKSNKNYLKFIVLISYVSFLLLAITLGDILTLPPSRYYTYLINLFPQLTVGLAINVVLGALLLFKLFFHKTA